MVTETLLFLPGGPVEIALILLVLVVLFGPNKIPKLAKAVGESLGKFEEGKKKAQQELEGMDETDSEETDEETEPEVEEEEN